MGEKFPNTLPGAICPHCVNSFPFWSYFNILPLQYPSATKNSPLEVTATSVGLQKCLSSLPGSSNTPRVRSGSCWPAGILITWDVKDITPCTERDKHNERYKSLWRHSSQEVVTIAVSLPQVKVTRSKFKTLNKSCLFLNSQCSLWLYCVFINIRSPVRTPGVLSREYVLRIPSVS